MRYYITKSPSGHYTVTGRSVNGSLRLSVPKLPSLHAARHVVELEKAKDATEVKRLITVDDVFSNPKGWLK